MESAQDCRATLLNAMLQLRLSGGRGYADDGVLHLDDIHKTWQARWPDGLAIPNPDLPDRDPLADDPGASVREIRVATAADPLLLRPPMGALRFDEAASMTTAISGLAEFLGDADIQHIDTLLTKSVARYPTQRFDASCQYQAKSQSKADAENQRRVDVKCASSGEAPHDLELEARLYFQGDSYRRGVMDRMRLKKETFADIALEAGDGRAGTARSLELHPRWRHRNVRFTNGALISALQFTGLSAKVDEAGVGSLRLDVRDDYVQVQALLHSESGEYDSGMALGLSGQPLRRAVVTEPIFSALGDSRVTSSVTTQRNLPPPRLEYQQESVEATPADLNAADAIGTLQRYCAACHDSAETFPPNFLSGNAATVASKLRHCAERIDYRLAMWAIDPAAREKSPMPPEYALHGFGLTPAQWLSGSELQRVLQYIHALNSKPGVSAQRNGNTYEQLQRCLPEGY
jgi:hypothetical protein